MGKMINFHIKVAKLCCLFGLSRPAASTLPVNQPFRMEILTSHIGRHTFPFSSQPCSSHAHGKSVVEGLKITSTLCPASLSGSGNCQRKRGRYRYGGGTSSFHPFSAPCSAHLVVVYIIRFKDSVGHCDVPVMILKLFSSFETTVKNIKQKSLTSIVWKLCLCFVGILLIPWILKFLPATFQRPRH